MRRRGRHDPDEDKPSTVRSYRQTLDNHILDDLGGARISEITRNNIQDLADRLLADGNNPSTVRNPLMPLRAIYRRALARGEVSIRGPEILNAVRRRCLMETCWKRALANGGEPAQCGPA